ncbi:MAG: carbon storage regulator CsrA [Planctomycetaceae bacterium]
MLVLTRKPGETIIIGNDIELTVVEIRGNRIRLGIKAPLETPIQRAELQERILKDREGQHHDSAIDIEPCRAA